MNLSDCHPLSPDGIRLSLDEKTLHRFHRNREILEGHPKHRVRSLVVSDLEQGHYTTIPAADGFPALIGFDNNGQVFPIDDLARPVRAQEEWLQGLEQEREVEALFLGFGAGHLTSLLESNLERFRHLIIIEPEPDLFAVACATYDLSRLAGSHKVAFWMPEDAFQAAQWVVEWLGSIQAKKETVVSLYLNPQFLLTSPRFLWNLAEELPREHERIRGIARFESMADSIAPRYTHPAGWSESWETALRFPGVGSFFGKGDNSPAFVVGPGPLSNEENQLLIEAIRRGHAVLTDARRFASGSVQASLILFEAQDPPLEHLGEDTTLVASIPAVCNRSLRHDTIVFWPENKPSVVDILPPFSTPCLLAEKGALGVRNGRLGTSLDLAVRLGCDPIVLLGCSLEEKKGDSTDLQRIGLRKQIALSNAEVLVVTEENSRDLPEAVRADPETLRKKVLDTRCFSLRRVLDEHSRKPVSVQSPPNSFDRSLSLDGQGVLDEEGKFLIPAEGPVLERIFAYNLQALRKALPELAGVIESRLRETSGTESYYMGADDSGYPRLEIQPAFGPRVVLPACDHPERLIAETELWKKLEPGDVNVFLGMGLGFGLEAIAARHEGRICFWEPIADRLLAAMHVRNLVPLFECRNISWLVGPGPSETADYLLTHHVSDLFRLPTNWTPLIEPGLRSSYSSYARDLVIEIKKREPHIRSTRIGFRQVAAKRGIRHIRNSIRLVDAVPLEVVRGQFSRVPAVIVGAGPSLEETAPLLNEIEDRALIFAVDTAYRYLQPREIDRHFVVTIDPKDESALHFRDRPPRETDILIASSGSPEEIWDLFQGIHLFGDFSTPLIQWFSEVLGFRLYSFWPGSSVSISALGVAHWMGCDPIILTGQDLAVRPDRTHVVDTIYPDRSEQTSKPKEFEVPSIGGGTVNTTHALYNIKRNLEHHIRWQQLNVINATAYGARIEGSREMPLGQVLDQLPDRKVPVQDRILELASQSHPGDRSRRLFEALKDWSHELEDFGNHAEALLSDLRRNYEEVCSGKFPEACLGRLSDLTRAMYELGLNRPAIQRLEDFTYMASAHYIHMTRRIRQAPDDRTRFKWEVERMIPFVEELLNASRLVRTEVGKVLAVLSAEAE